MALFRFGGELGLKPLVPTAFEGVYSGKPEFYHLLHRTGAAPFTRSGTIQDICFGLIVF
jgi:hypothetical protein